MMLRRLTLTEHGVLELGTGLVLIALPLILGLGPAALVACMLAGIVIAGLGLAEDLSISAHMAADAALTAGLLAAAVVLATAGHGIAAVLLAGAAAAELALTAGTRWTRRR